MARSAANAQLAARPPLGHTAPLDRRWAAGEQGWRHAVLAQPVKWELGTTAWPEEHEAAPKGGDEEPEAAREGEEEEEAQRP